MIKALVIVIFSFISTFGIVYVYYKYNDDSSISLKSILIFLCGVSLSFFNVYFEIPVLDYCAFFIFFPLMFYYICKNPIKKIFFYVFVIWLYGMLVDLFAMLIYSLIHFIFNIDLYSNIFFAEHIVTFSIFVALVFIGNSKKMKKFTNNLYYKIVGIKFSSVSILLFIISILIYGTVLFLNIDHLTTGLLISSFIVLFIITFILLIKNKINSDENERYLKTLKENNDFYIKLDDENRIFKHNLTAKLLSIKSVSNEKAQSLIEDLINQYNKNVQFSKGIKVIPYGLNGIIYEKLYPYIKELTITIVNNIDYDIFEYLKPRRYNVFVEKIVVALDNAIESTKNSEEKILSVNIYDEDNKIVVEINNTFGNMIDLDNFGKKSYSTKGKRRGLGIFSALRNNEASMSVKIVNNMFVSKISAKKRLTE